MMNRSRRIFAFAAITAVGLPVASACLHLSEAAQLPIFQFGAVSIRATAAANANAAATSTAIFFEAYSAGVPDSRNQINSCVFSTVDTTTQIVTGVKKAGTAVSLQIGANASSATIPLTFDESFKRYASAGATTYSSGDSVKVNIPGETGGFPASTISVRLAEPLLPGTVTLPATAAPLTITWNASPDTTSAIIISLKYANPATSSYANQQILCALKDDGTETIPSDAIGAVLLSPPGLRSLLLTRWRTQVVNPDANSVLHIVSVMDTLVRMN